MSSYAMPVIGEVFDFIWAPISAIIFFITFGGWKGAIGGIGNFFEELLPGTDIIPSFTLMWLSQRKSSSATDSTPVKARARLL